MVFFKTAPSAPAIALSLGDHPIPFNRPPLFVIGSKDDLSRRAVEESAVRLDPSPTSKGNPTASLKKDLNAAWEPQVPRHAGAGGMTKARGGCISLDLGHPKGALQIPPRHAGTGRLRSE